MLRQFEKDKFVRLATSGNPNEWLCVNIGGWYAESPQNMTCENMDPMMTLVEHKRRGK